MADQKWIINGLYNGALISVGTVGYSMLLKKVFKMGNINVDRFDINNILKLTLSITLSNLTIDYLEKMKYIPPNIPV